MAVNIKLDAVIKKLGIKEKDLLDAEEQSDEKLEREQKRMQHNSGSKAKKRS